MTCVCTGIVTDEYGSADRLARPLDAFRKVETFAYDGNGNLVSTTDRKLQTTTFTYDALNRRTRATYADGAVATSTYDAGGRLLQADDTADPHRPAIMEYDILDRLLVETTALGSVGYQYDALGRRTLLTLPNGVSTEYVYDPGSRLTALVYRNALGLLGDLTYQYDAAGNRIGVGGSFARTLLPDAVPLAAYDAANRQLQFGGKTMAFDDNGNLTTLTDAGGTTTFTWDARDRLVEVNGPTLAGSFRYDAFSRRAEKGIGGQTSKAVFDRIDAVLQRENGSDVPYLRTMAVDEPLVRGTDEYFLLDGLGSTLALSSSNGELTTKYSFEPFGQTISEGIPSANRFQFTGREADRPGFYYFRARYYLPVTSRFVSEDPFGMLSNDNRYAYVRNAPTNSSDPLGLDEECPGGRWRGRAVSAGGVVAHLGYSSTSAFLLFCVSKPSVTAPHVVRSVFIGVGAGGGMSYDFIQIENAPRRRDLYPENPQVSPVGFGGVGAFRGVGSGVAGSASGGGFQVGIGVGAGAAVGVNFSIARPE